VPEATGKLLFPVEEEGGGGHSSWEVGSRENAFSQGEEGLREGRSWGDQFCYSHEKGKVVICEGKEGVGGGGKKTSMVLIRRRKYPRRRGVRASPRDHRPGKKGEKKGRKVSLASPGGERIWECAFSSRKFEESSSARGGRNECPSLERGKERHTPPKRKLDQGGKKPLRQSK